MSILWKRDGQTFKVIEEHHRIIGIYNSHANELAEIEFSAHLPDQGKGAPVMPDGMLAQDGKMCSSFQNRSLCQMMNFYASIVAIRDKIEKIFVALDSLDKDGVAFLKKLGGVLQDLDLPTTTGKTEKVSGYVVPIRSMNEASAIYWYNDGWRLAPFHEQ